MSFLQGLAYVDFSDEEHLVAAIAKDKQKLLGKRLNIARSDPKQGRNKSSTRSTSSNSSRGMLMNLSAFL